MEQHAKATVGKPQPFYVQFARMVHAWMALWLTGSLVANAAANAVAAVQGTHTMTPLQWTVAVGITIPIRDPIVDIILICVVTGFITYMVLKYVCEQKWVTEQHKVEDCWEEKHWYNPWDWFTTIVCVVTWVAVQVLKWICAWKEVLVTVAVITCIIAGIIILA